MPQDCNIVLKNIRTLFIYLLADSIEQKKGMVLLRICKMVYFIDMEKLGK